MAYFGLFLWRLAYFGPFLWRVVSMEFLASGIFWPFFVKSGVFWPFLWRLAFSTPYNPLPKIKEMHYGRFEKRENGGCGGWGAFIKHRRVSQNLVTFYRLNFRFGLIFILFWEKMGKIVQICIKNMHEHKKIWNKIRVKKSRIKI